LIGYEYTSIWVIFVSGIVRFGFYSGKIELGNNRIGFKSVWFCSGSGCSCSIYFGLGHYGSGLNWVRSFRVWVISKNSSFVRLWIGLLWVFESRLVHPILVSVRAWAWVLRFDFRVWISFARFTSNPSRARILASELTRKVANTHEKNLVTSKA